MNEEKWNLVIRNYDYPDGPIRNNNNNISISWQSDAQNTLKNKKGNTDCLRGSNKKTTEKTDSNQSFMEASQFQKPTVGGSVFFLIDIGHVGGSLPFFFCFMFDGCKDKRSGPADYVKKNKKTKRK